MKRKLTLLSLLLFISQLVFSQIFIPKGDFFIEKKINLNKASLLNIAESLGYNSEQFYSYTNFNQLNSCIWSVVFKSFTDEIIFIHVKEGTNELPKEIVKNYLSDYNFSEEFDSYDIESTLENGILNKSLTAKFLNEIFGGDEINNGEINANSIGYILSIRDGLLVSFRSSDGLNKWARDWKTNAPTRYNKYKLAAEKYWGNNIEAIINEINVQADAFVNIPGGLTNDFIDLHRTNEGTINFKMLLVSHYKHIITLEEFKEINHGRYEIASDFSDDKNNKITTYRINKTLISFSENGKLINCYTSNY